MLTHFGNMPFMPFQAQGFPSYSTPNAYDAKKADLKRTVQPVPIGEVPNNANTISSLVICNVIMLDDLTLELKAGIFHHVNEDRLLQEQESDCEMCSPVGMRLIISVTSLYRWRLSKLDVKNAFLQT